MKTNREKLKRMVHYICDRVSDPWKLGSTKLNKILYYVDFGSYFKLGRPITGETYVKRQHGPVAYDILRIEEELVDEEKIAIRTGDYFGYKQKRYFALEEPDLSIFSADEISIVEKVIDLIAKNHSATSISLASHNHIWEAAELGEEIPYQTSLINELGEINQQDVEWAQEIIDSRESEASIF
jgi:hypothetical protein